MNYTIVWKYKDTDIYSDNDYHFEANSDNEATSRANAFGSLPRVGKFSIWKTDKNKTAKNIC